MRKYYNHYALIALGWMIYLVVMSEWRWNTTNIALWVVGFCTAKALDHIYSVKEKCEVHPVER